MRILVINLMPFLGEMLFITPVFRALRDCYPDAELEALVEKKSLQVILHNPFVDRIMTMEKRGADRGIIGHLRVMKMLRRRRYDLVVDFTGSERSTIISACSGGARIRGLAKGPFSLCYPFLRRDKTIHMVDSCLQVLARIGLAVKPAAGMEMHLPASSLAKAEAIWREKGLAEAKVIGIHVNASQPWRAWSVAACAQLTDLLAERGWKVVHLGGPGELKMVEAIQTLAETEPIILTGQLNLLELAAVIRRCAMLVSVDSGPLHVAASQQVPVVALFGPSDPIRYHPYRVRHLVIRSGDGSMRSISAGQVAAAVEELGRGGGAAS